MDILFILIGTLLSYNLCREATFFTNWLVLFLLSIIPRIIAIFTMYMNSDKLLVTLLIFVIAYAILNLIKTLLLRVAYNKSNSFIGFIFRYEAMIILIAVVIIAIKTMFFGQYN